MKYKVGDHVRVKSLDWYTSNKDKLGKVWTESLDGESQICFDSDMIQYCGMETVIFSVERENYVLRGIPYAWTDEMIECKVEESKPNIIEEAKTYWDSIKDAWVCPEGYQFVDENGNVINATKIVLEKKKREYPKTYEECCYVLGFENTELVFEDDYRDINPPKEQWKRLGLMNQLNKLLICRDAYWKIAGEEMGLGKPWTPQDTNTFSIFYDRLTGEIEKQDGYCGANSTLEFPTEEMRDAFYENFKELIEQCKELL